MKLSKLLGISVLGVSAVAMASCGGADASNLTGVEKIKANGKIVVTTNAEFAPFEYKQGANFVGIDMDIIKAYATSLGVECEIKDIDFDAALTSVQQGKSDVTIAGVTKNEKREEVMDFTKSYYTANQVVIVKENSAYASLTTAEATESLFTANKATIGCQRGTTGQYYIEGDADWEFAGIAGTTSKTYDNGGLACQDLINGKIEAVIIDAAPAKILASKFEGLKVLDFTLTEEEYAIAVTKGNTELINSLNAFIDTIKANGEFDKIVSKYYEA